MLYRFTYEGNTPSKKNSKKPVYVPRKDKKTGLMVRRMLFVPSDAHKIWHTAASWELRRQMNLYPLKFPILRCKHVGLKIFWGDMHGRDNSNLWESVLDLAKDVGILKDDAWQITGNTYQFPTLRRGQPGWELFIETFDIAPGPTQEHHIAVSPAAEAAP